MKKVLFIFLIFCFSLNIISCSSSSDEDDIDEIMTTDTTAATLAEVTFVTTPTNDSTPDYTFSSDEAGTITYGGSCSSSTTSAIDGNNTITLVSLSEGTYSDCTITVTDEAGNISITLTITSFIVDTTVPVISGSTITTPTNDSTPNYTFSSDEAGTITYGGSCSSGTTSATSGNNTITFDTLSAGTYSDCTIIVTDSDGNASNTLAITSFIVNTTTDTTRPTVSSVSTTADNQSSVSITDNITVTFSEAMDTTYVTTSTSDTYCAGTIRVSSDNFSSCVKMSSDPISSNDNKTFTLDPYDNLTGLTTYKTRVTTGVKDAAGNSMSSQYDNSTGFTTASTDTTAPVIAQVTAVTTPTNDKTPNYTFSSTEAGTITYGGSCSSSTTSATTDNNTITFSTLDNGTHSNCTIKVTDSSANVSNTLEITDFTVSYWQLIARQVDSDNFTDGDNATLFIKC